MDDRTLAALKASIAKWENNTRAETPGKYLIEWPDCALCLLFYSNDCNGCPVSRKTNLNGCDGIPYQKAADAYSEWEDATDEGKDWKESEEEFSDRIAALRDTAQWRARYEVDFLKSLLPKETPDATV